MSTGEKKRPGGVSGYVVELPESIEPERVQLALELLAKLAPRRRDCPTLAAFAIRFIDEYAKANRQKARTVDSKLSIINNHLVPAVGGVRLDDLRESDIQKIKATLEGRTAKTVNNVLSVLRTMLTVAVRWDVLEKVPVRIDPVRAHLGDVSFYDFGEYMRLFEVAFDMDFRIAAIVILGGDAGLRCGEMIGLEWDDVDFSAEQLHIRRAESRGHVDFPKGGKIRHIPMTERLQAVMQGLYAKNRVGRVLRRDNGRPAAEQTLRTWISRAQRAAGLDDAGALHILRHTFCSHLAMRGAPPLAIKELAGHRSFRTTMRYMHLCNTEAKRAIGLIDKSRASIDGGLFLPGASSVMSPAGFEPAGSIHGVKSAESGADEVGEIPPESAATRRPNDTLSQWQAFLDGHDQNKSKQASSSNSRRANPRTSRKAHRPKRR